VLERFLRLSKLSEMTHFTVYRHGWCMVSTLHPPISFVKLFLSVSLFGFFLINNLKHKILKSVFIFILHYNNFFFKKK
jgi:hypothetical protein